MKTTQITSVINGKIMGTTLRAVLVQDQELVTDIMGDENCPQIVPGALVNVGEKWYKYQQDGNLEDVTGSTKNMTNSALFDTEKRYKDALAQKMEFRFGKETKVLFGDKDFKQKNPSGGDETVATEEKDANDVKNMKKDAHKRLVKSVKGGKFGRHGQSKEKASQEAQADINACSGGFLAVIQLLRKAKADGIADKLQNMMYDRNLNEKSFRKIAADLNQDINDYIDFMEEWADEATLKDVLALKEMVDGQETRRSLLDLLVGLILWTQVKIDGFVKKWSKGKVVFPIKVLMLMLNAIIEVVRTFTGAMVYVVNGVACFATAFVAKLASWVLNIVTYITGKIGGWFSKKDTPVAETPEEAQAAEEAENKPVTEEDIDAAITGAIDEVVEESLGELFD